MWVLQWVIDDNVMVNNDEYYVLYGQEVCNVCYINGDYV